MNRPLAIGLLAVGVILLILGINASDSFASEFSEFFSGTPTHESIWLMVGGVLLAVIGLAGTLRKPA